MDGAIIRCRAAVQWEANKPLIVEDIEVAAPKNGEVRIKLHATAVCHTDVTAQKGLYVEKNFPCILGHEGAGVVESIGKNVTTVKPGDKVIPLYKPECNKCRHCESGKTNRCIGISETQLQGVMPDGTSRFTCKGKTIYHFMGTSTFSEYTVVPEIAVAKIHENAPLDKICLLGCGIPTGFGAVVNIAKVTSKSVCAVWGLGCIGLSAIMACKYADARRIFAIDINPRKFAKAIEFGATDCLNPNDFDKTIPEVLRDLTNGMGVEYAIECVGLVKPMTEAIEAACEGYGMTVIMGVPSLGEIVPLDNWHLIDGKTITGGGFGGYYGRTDVPKLVEKYLNGELKVDEFITHHMSLDKINTAFDLINEGESIRTVIHYYNYQQK